jgi:DNA-binding CsgD family transcriptional regulator
MEILRRALDIGTGLSDEVDIVSRLQQVCDHFDIEHACFASKIPGNDTLVGFATYSESWRKHYLEHEFHLIDPTLQQMMHAMAPVDWARLRHLEGYDPVFRAAGDFAIPSMGMSVPIRGPFGERSVLTIATQTTQRLWEVQRRTIIEEVQQVSALLHDEIMRSGKFMTHMNCPTLSQREIEILQWTACGKSQQDVADILNISNRTVEVHLRSARSKLYAVTTAQAVARAVGMKLIYPL